MLIHSSLKKTGLPSDLTFCFNGSSGESGSKVKVTSCGKELTPNASRYPSEIDHILPAGTFKVIFIFQRWDNWDNVSSLQGT